MTWQTSTIWRGLAAMRIEPEGAALSFEARLARENGWSAAHAEAVMEAYRRFLYLVANGDGAVTPSEDVDQAWHLHLAYSRHYWDVLCGAIIGQTLHHGPTEGGAIEQGRYQRQYEATLERYRIVFGEDPPAAVWPDPVTRFAARPLRIDAARYWLVPRALAGRGAVVAGAGLLAACSAYAATSGEHSDSSGDFGWAMLGLLVIFVILVAGSANRANGKRGKRGDGSGCGGGGCGSDSKDGGSDSGCGGGCGGGD